MHAFIYDCTPRREENGAQTNEYMMGIPSEITEDEDGDLESLSQQLSASDKQQCTRSRLTGNNFK